MKRMERLREYIYQRKLRQQRTAATKPITRLSYAQSVAICFPAHDLKERKQVLAYADRLRKQGKRVKLLAFIPTVDKEATFDFDHFTQRDISWAAVPKGLVIEQFLSQSYDAFICLFTKTNPQIEFLSGVIGAGLQIGPCPERSTARFDIMIDASSDMRITDFIQSYEYVFEKAERPVLEEA